MTRHINHPETFRIAQQVFCLPTHRSFPELQYEIQGIPYQVEKYFLHISSAN